MQCEAPKKKPAHTVIIKIMLLETQGETKAPSDPNTDAPTRALMN